MAPAPASIARTNLLLALPALAALGGAAPACGGSISVTPQDAAAPVDANSAPDAGPPADAATPDASGPSLLAAGDDIAIWGITSDDVVVYSVGSTLSAVSIQGGAPSVIASSFSGVAQVDGAVALFWVNGMPGQIALSGWTSRWGTQALSSAFSGVTTGVSPDGSAAFLVEGIEDGTGVGDDVVVAKLDGSDRTTILAGVSNASCAFSGNGVLSCTYCTAQCATGMTTSTFAAGTFAQSASAPSGASWSSPSGTMAIESTGSTDAGLTYSLVDTTAGTAVGVPLAGQIETGMWDGAGASFYALLTDGAIVRVSASAPSSPTTLGASGAVWSRPSADFFVLSPDGALLAYSTSQLDGFTANLSLVATTTHAASPGSIEATTDVFALPGAPLFTADSSHVLFVTNSGTAAPGSVTLHAAAVSGGASTVIAPTLLASDIDSPLHTGAAFATLAGAQVVVAESSSMTYPGVPPATTEDIVVYDLATGASQPLVNGAYATPVSQEIVTGDEHHIVGPRLTGFVLSSNRSRLAYSTPQSPRGLYAVATQH